MFSKKTDKTSELAALVLALKKYNPEDVQQVALELLGKDAQDWWDHRAKTKRLLNERGEWVSEFQANGETYYILKPNELSEDRFTKLRKLEAQVGMDASMADLVASANRMSDYYNTIFTKEPKAKELALEIANFQYALRDKVERNWDYTLFAATTVIVRRGGNKEVWEEREASKDIANWNLAGYPASDFFLLVMSYTSLWNEWLQASLEKVAKKAMQNFMGL